MSRLGRYGTGPGGDGADEVGGLGAENARFVEEVRFKPVRFREGYDMRSVDELLDRLVDAFRAGRSVRGIVEAAQFPLVKLREGYATDEVDQFLQEVLRRDVR
ncbi:DivIVA domain-containing protein [Pimelobacter simplex]|uniref:DivIVA domain-containing protein n=1 Tax=Nocardioides simplex TaxID=2045 RepID=UPI00214FCA14|nr:DivIVA domain-containing protein [Pimelobacter simplex]UUW90309.1 DivIVA domain-containing protein [Pimelobacter simplex]UUW94139.1 DivIVA domain-containing protein [Pimelobacter simplex]